MPAPEINIATINIMGREFKIKCPPNKTAELEKAATYLNSKMQEIQRGDKSTTLDRVAITAGLNITHELILEKQHLNSHTDDTNELSKRFTKLKQKLNQALLNAT